MNEEEIERKAVEELLLEAKRGRERAEEHGAFGWNKPKVAAVNKRFLKNTLVSTMRGEAGRREVKNSSWRNRSMGIEQRNIKQRDGVEEIKDKDINTTKHKVDHNDSEHSPPSKTRREKIYDTNDYIRLNETYKKDYLKDKSKEKEGKETHSAEKVLVEKHGHKDSTVHLHLEKPKTKQKH